ncbi:MAG TPA: GAF domain-containing protein [Terriglobales bacterium]|nr:GAF domain-containing protein [Terriglobales bacterium]
MQFASARSVEPGAQTLPPSSDRGSAAPESLSNLDDCGPIVERALNCTGATGAILATWRDQDMVCVATAGSLTPPVGTKLETRTGFSGRCIYLRRLLRCDDTENDSRIDGEKCRALGIHSMAAVPIEANGVVFGLLEVFSRRAHAFSEISDLDLEFLARSLVLVGRRGPQPIGDKSSSAEKEPGNTEDESRVDSDRQLISSFLRFKSNYYKLGLALTCLAIAGFSWLKLGRTVLAPTRADVQTAIQNINQPEPAIEGTNDLPEIATLAEQGDAAAQFALGAQYATGDNVQQDYTQAVRWFSKAAEQGHVLAQATLGAYYLAGRGVPTDLSKAYFWSILAQAGGDQASEYRVNLIKSRLSLKEILAITQQANNWLKLHHQITPKELNAQP